MENIREKGIIQTEDRASVFAVMAAVHRLGNADPDGIVKETGLDLRKLGRIMRALGKLGVLIGRLRPPSRINFAPITQPPFNFFGSIFFIELYKDPMKVLENDFTTWLKESGVERVGDENFVDWLRKAGLRPRTPVDENFVNWVIRQASEVRFKNGVIIENCNILMSQYMVMITAYATGVPLMHDFNRMLSTNTAVSNKKLLFITHSVGRPVG